QTFVPSRCAAWLRGHGHAKSKATMFAKWEGFLNAGIQGYTKLLGRVLKVRRTVIAAAFGLLALVLIVFGLQLRQEFFPEVDAGAFEVYVRTKSGTRIEVTEGYIEAVESYIKKKLGTDLEIVISEIGLTADWSAAFTPNAGPMDTVMKVQLTANRKLSAQDAVHVLRRGVVEDPDFQQLLNDVYQRRMRKPRTEDERLTPDTPAFSRTNLEFSFDAGGMIRSAMNEGRSTPINARITTKDLVKARKVADRILSDVKQIDGVVDARILQRLDYPQYVIDVDQSKASSMQLTQTDVMRNIIAAFNSSVQFNKRNFWIDPKSHN